MMNGVDPMADGPGPAAGYPPPPVGLAGSPGRSLAREAAVRQAEGEADEARDHADNEDDPLFAGRGHHLGIEAYEQGHEAGDGGGDRHAVAAARVRPDEQAERERRKTDDEGEDASRVEHRVRPAVGVER
jgi:hypothetical protein